MEKLIFRLAIMMLNGLIDMKITTGTTQIMGLVKSVKSVKFNDDELRKYINDWFME